MSAYERYVRDLALGGDTDEIQSLRAALAKSETAERALADKSDPSKEAAEWAAAWYFAVDDREKAEREIAGLREELGAKLWHWQKRATAAEASLSQALARIEELEKARPEADWRHDDGYVVWWTWKDGAWLGEPAYIGSPLCDDWPEYHTHWTPHPAFPATPIDGGKG